MDDDKLLNSIPAIQARLSRMTRQELVNVWVHAVDTQAETSNGELKAATGRLLDVVDAQFATASASNDYLEVGPLGFLGYHVGRSAATPARRRQARLTAIFRRPIPAVFPQSYRTGWGAPGTVQRLQRMATAIAGFIKDPRWRKDEGMQDAIAEWREDLAYLRETHHRGEFFWPET